MSASYPLAGRNSRLRDLAAAPGHFRFSGTQSRLLFPFSGLGSLISPFKPKKVP